MVLALIPVHCASAYALNTTHLDCGVRRLLHRRAVTLQPWHGHQLEVFDALELSTLCGDARPAEREATPPEGAHATGDFGFTAIVCPRHGDDRAAGAPATRHDDERRPPFATVAAALAAARRSGASRRSIVLRQGVHLLHATLELGPGDSGTTISAAQGEEAWLSGGVAIPVGAAWKRPHGSSKVWTLEIPDLDDVPGFFSLDPTAKSGAEGHRRFTRARFPNGDAEKAQWGYASQGRYNTSLPAGAVLEWHRPPPHGKVPGVAYVDLSIPGNPSGAIKNDSTMREYNSWGSSVPGLVQGDVCAQVWDAAEHSYWCGNNSAGGWAEVDREAAMSGQLGIPVGLTFYSNYSERYNCNWADVHEACRSQPLGPRAAKWADPQGAIVHAWHSQSWAMHMFEVAVGGFDRAHNSLRFARGGWQGGRNWCRCDQCTYAGKWCTQHATTPPKTADTRLIGGDFFIENIAEELDEPGEYFFNRTTSTLHFWANGTDPSEQAWSVPVLQRLITLVGTMASPVTDVTISGVGFRDAAATYMDERWAPPSGGDWALHRGGGAHGDLNRCSRRRMPPWSRD